MAEYEKLTLDSFKKKLNANGYQGGLTGARRAIGKTDWADGDKDKARKLAEKFFGDGGEVKAPLKVAAKKTAAPKKIAASARGKGTAKKAARKAPAKKGSRSPSTEATQRTPVEGIVAAPTTPILGVGEHADLACVVGVLANKQLAGLELSDWEQELYQRAGSALSARLDTSTPEEVQHLTNGHTQEDSAPESAEPITNANPVVAAPEPVPAPIVAPGVPVTVTAKLPPIPTMQATTPGQPTIILPKGNDPEGAASLPPEKRAQYDLLQKAGEVVKSMNAPAAVPNGSNG